MTSTKGIIHSGLLWKILLLLVGITFLAAMSLWIAVYRSHWIPFYPTSEILHERALLFLLQIPLPDRDGAGVPDWVDEFVRHDWVNRTVIPDVLAPCATSPLTPAGPSRGFMVYSGERTRIRARMGVFGLVGVWPRGFRATVAADKPVLFLPGHPGPATTGPLELVATSSGTLDFDILVPGDDPEIEVNLVNQANGRFLDDGRTSNPPYFGDNSSIVRCVGKRLPAIPCRSDWEMWLESPFFTWDRVPGASGYVIEAATTSRPNEWMPLTYYGGDGGTNATPMFYPGMCAVLGGRPRYRVVPTVWKP